MVSVSGSAALFFGFLGHQHHPSNEKKTLIVVGCFSGLKYLPSYINGLFHKTHEIFGSLLITNQDDFPWNVWPERPAHLGKAYGGDWKGTR